MIDSTQLSVDNKKERIFSRHMDKTLSLGNYLGLPLNNYLVATRNLTMSLGNEAIHKNS